MTPATRARRDQAGEWRKGLIDREDGWQQGFSGRAGRGAQAGPGVRHNKVGPGDQGQQGVQGVAVLQPSRVRGVHGVAAPIGCCVGMATGRVRCG